MESLHFDDIRRYYQVLKGQTIDEAKYKAQIWGNRNRRGLESGIQLCIDVLKVAFQEATPRFQPVILIDGDLSGPIKLSEKEMEVYHRLREESKKWAELERSYEELRSHIKKSGELAKEKGPTAELKDQYRRTDKTSGETTR